VSRLVPYAGSSAARKTPVGAASPASQTPSAEDRLEAVAKYIPGEILAFFLPATSAVEMLARERRPLAHWVVFGLSCALVPVYFRWVAHGDPRGARQIAISTLAFPVWALLTAFLVPRRP
jgi:hypothetical protein